MQTPVILNSKKEKIVLNERERHNCKWMANALWGQYGRQGEVLKNAIGYEIAITTLTTITRKISEQKFYMFKPSDYIPVVAGEGTWSSNLETYRSYDVSDVFESGIIDVGGNNDRLSAADTAIDALQIKVFNWAKSVAYSIPALEMAAKSGNWDLVSAKEKARKRNYDLGIQRIAFLGASGFNSSSGNCLGLLNQPGVTFNTTLLSASLSSLSYTDINTFAANAIAKYQANVNYSAMPTHLVMPQLDYNGLASQVNPEFPVKNKLEFLYEAFKIVTANPNFKILPVVYAQAAQAGSGVLPASAATSIYALYNYDEESMRMNVPLPYTTTLSNSVNNFQFQNVGYSEFTGMLLLRPLELFYFGY